MFLGDAEGLAGETVEEVALERLAGCEGDRVHQAVEAVPVLADLFEEAGDLGVVLHVEREDQRAAEVRGELGDAILEAVVLIGEGKFRAFAVHGLGNAVRNRTVAQQTRDQDSFAGEKAHGLRLRMTRRGL